jgi:hypothetical protein
MRRSSIDLLVQHVGIPETDDVITVGRKCAVARAIMHIFCMLASVHFDNKLFLSANEIHDIRAYCFLADEFETA